MRYGVCIYGLLEVTSYEIVPWLLEVITEDKENMITKLLSFSAIILALLTTNAPSTIEDGSHDDHALKCARLCAECQVECDACYHHCEMLVISGDKDHVQSMQLCLDCADCCKLCSSLVARQSPFSKKMSELCAACCDECAKSCSKFPKDKKMMACAAICKKCAESCREIAK